MAFGIDDAIVLALMAAGTAASVQGQRQAANAQDEQIQAELARQAALQGQADEVTRKSVEQFSQPQAERDINRGAAQNLQRIEDVKSRGLGLPNSPLDLGREPTVVGPGQKALAHLSNIAASRLGGYSEWDLQQWLKNLQAQQQLGVNATQSRLSNQPLGLELQQAGHAGDTALGVGSLLNTAGLVYGMGNAYKTPVSGVAGTNMNAPFNKTLLDAPSSKYLNFGGLA